MEKKSAALIIGATRGLGLALTEEFLLRGWNVVGTARQEKTALNALSEKYAGQLRIEQLDITDQSQLENLHRNIGDVELDVLFINAGTANEGGMSETIAQIAESDFVRVMVTNTFAPMRAAEALKDRVRSGGVIGVMSSGQGSIADNERGSNDVYRASKAALNMIMRSFAAREGKNHSLLLLAPGWVQTDMGGSNATFTIAEVTPKLVDTITDQIDKRGLQFLDRFGKTVRW